MHGCYIKLTGPPYLGALVVAMVNIVALRLCGLLPQLKLIYLFVKVACGPTSAPSRKLPNPSLGYLDFHLDWNM